MRKKNKCGLYGRVSSKKLLSLKKRKKMAAHFMSSTLDLNEPLDFQNNVFWTLACQHKHVIPPVSAVVVED